MELPIERRGVQAIMGTMKKKSPITPEVQARFDRNQRVLEERIAYHERKAAEEKKSV